MKHEIAQQYGPDQVRIGKWCGRNWADVLERPNQKKVPRASGEAKPQHKRQIRPRRKRPALLPCKAGCNQPHQAKNKVGGHGMLSPHESAARPHNQQHTNKAAKDCEPGIGAHALLQ